ncbi:hypothetical protein CPT_Muenster_147 [Klebsiella phage Muenster]|nr:hypothetical protein CPT_Muenster_147 [Klebsiella phage Muenster]
MIKPHYYCIHYLGTILCNEFAKNKQYKFSTVIRDILLYIEKELTLFYKNTEYTYCYKKYKILNLSFDNRGFLYVMSTENYSHLVLHTDLS